MGIGMPSLTQLSDIKSLEAVIAESSDRPVLLFKHSRSCGVSCEALDELHGHIESGPGGVSYGIITVQSHRHVSDAAAQRLGLRHETPQAILVRDGRVEWSATHFAITAETLSRILNVDSVPAAAGPRS
jgi:bacillithiol system protein YtxJ